MQILRSYKPASAFRMRSRQILQHRGQPSSYRLHSQLTSKIMMLQVLVYFAVAKNGEKPLDGKTDRNPEGLTAAWGPHAESIADRLQEHDLSCKLPGRDAFKQAMLEKLVWIW